MCCGRHLEQTPGLIDPDPADDVRNVGAGIGIGPGSVGADGRGAAQVVDGGTIPDGRIVETDTPLPNSAVYWMLFTPVSVLLPPSRFELMLPGKPFQGVE